MLRALVALMSGGVEEAHTFWRMKDFSLPLLGVGLDLSELRIFANGVDVTASATLTASNNPIGNNLSDLVDNSTTSAVVSWGFATVPTLWLKFEFPTSVAVDGVKQAAWTSALRFLEQFTLEWSDDDSTWTPLFSRGMLPDPGVQTLSSLYEALPVPVTGHRYWSISGVTTGGGGTGNLELSEFNVFESGSPVGASAAVIDNARHANNQPSYIGSIANWTDGNLSNRYGWFAADAQQASWRYRFDFGTGVYKEITGVKQGGYDTASNFAAAFSLSYSDDGLNWTVFGSKSGLTYPGNNTLSSEYTFP
jgi:hypothetical protein